MKSLFLSALMLVASVLAHAEIATTVYSDDFNRESVEYTLVQPEGVSVIIESGTLKLPSPLNNTSGKIFVTGSLASYRQPFADNLSHIQADSLVWMWNMRQNYATGSNYLGGFENNKRGMAIILAADNADLTVANGYAVVQGGNQKINYRLVRFSNGLTANNHVTDIIEGTVLSNPKNRMAAKVVYLPQTNTWRFYLSEGNSTAFVDPAATTDYQLYGAAVDNTWTNSKMTTFGFHINIAASTKVNFNVWIDNYSLTTYTDYEPDTTQVNPPVVVHNLEIPHCISSHMVVQRGVPVPVWGWGTAGDTVVAEWSILGQTLVDSAIVNADGRWKLFLPQQSACATPSSLTLHVLGTPLTQTLSDILVGDVWMAGGQSNMEKRMDHLTEYAQYMAEAEQYPLIRYCRTSYNALPRQSDRSKGNPWFVCDSSNLSLASAVAYVFARELQENLDIPIGILGAYRGGTELETWMSRTKLETDPQLAFAYSRIAGADSTAAGTYPTINYNGQVHPITSYAIKGFIFYQGEGNAKRALEYRFMQGKLIEDWREHWSMGDLPFYFVQLFNVGPTSTGWYEEINYADIREQQALLSHDEELPNTGMAVIIETNEQAKNKDGTIRMHPHNKKPVGQRLAWLALNHTYGLDIAGDSPSMKRHYTSNDTMYIVFRDVEDGLAIRRDSAVLAGFAISGSTRHFVQAQATIVNDSTVAVFSPSVQEPYAVRYAWAKDPICNLINSAGLPAGPFRTDAWPSEVSYSIPANTAAPNTDNTLLCIHVNGEKLADFSNDITDYQLIWNQSLGKPYVTAIARHPMSTVTISQMVSMTGEKEAFRTAKVTVTAEDGSQRVFRIVFNITTTPQAIVTMPIEDKAEKRISNGELLIQKKDKIYTATGAML